MEVAAWLKCCSHGVVGSLEIGEIEPDRVTRSTSKTVVVIPPDRGDAVGKAQSWSRMTTEEPSIRSSTTTDWTIHP